MRHLLRFDADPVSSPYGLMKPESNMPPSPGLRSPRYGRRRLPVEITRPKKIIDPSTGCTKADVASYYRKVAKRLLPFLKDRPVTLERLPDGLGEDAPHFWQKNTPDTYPDWLPRAVVENEQGKPVHYAVINDLPSLLYLINKGALSFHPWLSRTTNLNRPDFVLFDLDVGQATFADAVVVAKRLYEVLIDDSKPSFVKTTGKMGLHVLVPWWQSGGYDEARLWAAEVAGLVVTSLPSRATTEVRKTNRGSRVYIDVMQNARGRHTAAPYVLRATPGLPVSTPLRWADLTENLDPEYFNIRTIPNRISKQKQDPMTALLGRKRGTMGRRKRVG